MQHSVQHTSEYSHFKLSMSRPMCRPTNKFLVRRPTRWWTFH